jgi:hypothetical protein
MCVICEEEGPVYANRCPLDTLELEILKDGHEFYRVLLHKGKLYMAQAGTLGRLRALIKKSQAQMGDELRINAKYGTVVLLEKGTEKLRMEASCIEPFEAHCGARKFVTVPLLGLYLFQLLEDPEFVNPSPSSLDYGYIGIDLRITARGLTLFRVRQTVFSTLGREAAETRWKYGRDPYEEALVEKYLLVKTAAIDSFKRLELLRDGKKMDTADYEELQNIHDTNLHALAEARKALENISSYFLEYA